ncbi:esterase/lipase family protein [Paludisphaera rhizosphaerae]|uniref:esterase/lipase family protein n=1 Tax=Paludisphaera rhizosphaerae TaxID=2711216 RepID=UPI0013EB9E8B|nr:alpha/beta fold hydrolase [Paludisphaera rhizosphaerae]
MKRSEPRIAAVWVLPWAWILLAMMGAADRRVEVPIDAQGRVAVSRIVASLADATGVQIKPPDADLTLPVRGLSGSLGRSLLSDSLGKDVEVEFEEGTVVFQVPDGLGRGASAVSWRGRLEELSAKTEEAASSRARHVLQARPSYRPNDPSRPTVCLVHGLNSSSGGFAFMIPLLEEAGYGVVTFDYPFNQRLDDSCEQFRSDWVAFRERVGERRSWSLLGHSMGCLVARAYIEGPGKEAGDVDSLILIAPVNGGAHIARLQPVLQMIGRFTAVRGRKTTRALSQLADGSEGAADDMLPGSPFLTRLNRRPRNEAVPYHIIAGNIGLLTIDGRKQIEDQLDLMGRNSGPFGFLTQLASTEVLPILDELTDGTGDGAVTVEATRLKGAPDPVLVAANHAELIRAPILFSDPGPVVTMPWILSWLKEDHAARPAANPERPAPRD